VNSSLNQLIPQGEPHVSRAADSHSFALSASPEPFFSKVVIRHATAGDRTRLRRLAQLDSAQPLEGDTLVGEVHGQLVAALSLADGRSIADPFMLAQPILELMVLRARQLRPEARAGRLKSRRSSA
jgi:hypothetical protein